VELQLALLAVNWPAELLAAPQAAELYVLPLGRAGASRSGAAAWVDTAVGGTALRARGAPPPQGSTQGSWPSFGQLSSVPISARPSEGYTAAGGASPRAQRRSTSFSAQRSGPSGSAWRSVVPAADEGGERATARAVAAAALVVTELHAGDATADVPAALQAFPRLLARVPARAGGADVYSRAVSEPPALSSSSASAWRGPSTAFVTISATTAPAPCDAGASAGSGLTAGASPPGATFSETEHSAPEGASPHAELHRGFTEGASPHAELHVRGGSASRLHASAEPGPAADERRPPPDWASHPLAAGLSAAVEPLNRHGWAAQGADEDARGPGQAAGPPRPRFRHAGPAVGLSQWPPHSRSLGSMRPSAAGAPSHEARADCGLGSAGGWTSRRGAGRCGCAGGRAKRARPSRGRHEGVVGSPCGLGLSCVLGASSQAHWPRCMAARRQRMAWQ
jgi:hypothetical protein